MIRKVIILIICCSMLIFVIKQAFNYSIKQEEYYKLNIEKERNHCEINNKGAFVYMQNNIYVCFYHAKIVRL